MIQVLLKGRKEALDQFDEKPVRKAIVSSLRKVIATGRTVASEEIRNRYNLKKSDLDPRLEVNLGRVNDLVAQITVSGKGMSLSYFGAQQTVGNKVVTRAGKGGGLKTKTMKRSAKFQGVTVEVEKGKRTQLKSAFLAQMQSGHIGVMHRWNNGKLMKGKNKTAIGEKGVISIASMAQSANVEPAIIKRVNEAWGTTFPHELERQLGLASST